MTRRTRASLLGGLAAVLLIVLILIGFFPQDVLRRYAERRLQEGLGPGSSVKRMHILPWRLRTEVTDLVIEGPTYRLVVPRAQMIVRPGFVFGGDLSFRSLELESPTLEVRAGGDAKPYQPLAQPLLVEDLSVTDGRIVYHLSPQSRLTLEGVRMKGGIGTGTPLEVAITGGQWQSDKTLALGPATGRLRVSSSLDIAVDTLDATVAHSKIHASGTLGHIGDLFPRIKFNADVDLQDLAAIGAGPEMSGRVKAEGMIEGLGKDMRLDAEIGGSRVRVGQWPIDRIDAHLAHAGGLRGRTDVEGEAQLLGGSASGTVALRDKDTDARVLFRGIRAEALRERGIALPWPEQGPLNGQITAQGDWDGALRVKAEATTAGPGPLQLALEVKAFAEGTVRLKASAVDLAFKVEVDGSRPAVGELPRLRSLALTLQGRARGPLPPTVDGGFEGALRVEMASGQEPMPVQGTFRYDDGAYAFTANAEGMGGTLVARGEGRGSVLRRLHVEGNDVQLALARPEADGVADFELNASGPFDRLTGTGTVSIEDLLWKDERVGNVTAQVEGNQGQGRFTFLAPELRARGQGTFDGTVAHATITLDETPMDRLAAFLPFARPVTGVTSGVLELTIPFRDPASLTVDARLDRLDVASGTLRARATAPVVGRLRNGVLELDEVQAEGNGVVATVSGSLGLDPDSRLDARVRFEVDLTKVPKPQTELTLTGVVQGDVALSGTRGRPRAFGEVTFNGVTVQHPRAAEVLTLKQGRLWLRGDMAVVENVRADVGGGWVELTGTVPVAAVLPITGALELGLEPAEADLVLRWEGVQAAALVEALRPGPSRLAASLSGEARLAGTLGTWRDAHGELRLVPTDVRVQDLSVNVAPVVARLDQGRLTTDGLVVDVEGTQFRVDGSADLRRRTFEAQGRGTLELRALSPFLEEASLTGVADVDVTANGTFRQPNAAGHVAIRDASLRMRDIPQPLSQIRALVTLDRQGIQLTDGTAQLGGGTIRFDGTARLAGLSIDDVRIAAKGEQLGIRYPLTRNFTGRTGQLLEDLKARVDADLTLTGKPGDFVLAGTLAVERSLYDSDINLEEALLAPEVPPAPSEPSRALRAIGLNLAVLTVNPFIVRNNLAQIEAEGGLVIRGDMDEPAPYGRFEILPGGKVFLQGREFAVEGGSLAFSGTTDPDVTVRASTLIKQPDQDIEATIVAEGVLPQLTLDLSSTPSLPEREIASLIATGRADAFANPRWWVAGEQAAALLAGRFTRRVAKELIDLGLDQVDIQPELIAREGEPSARFTFGKQLSPSLKVIYSMGLSDPESQYYEAQYELRPGRALTLKLQRRFDGIFTYGAGQRLSFGGPKRTTAPTTFEPTQLRDVRLEGELLEFPELMTVIKAKRGQKKTYWDLLDDSDRMRQHLVKQGYLEAIVDARLDDDAAVFIGVVGRRHRWAVEGMESPPSIDDILHRALFAEEGEEKARQALLEELRRRGHLKATVETRTRHDGDAHRMVFHAEPGPLVRADVTFPGATALAPDRLLEASGGAPILITEARKAEEAVRAEYRKEHYLSPKIGPIRTAEEPGVIRVEMPIVEGPRAVVAAIRFPGAQAVPEVKLAELAALKTGVPYDATAVNEAILRLRDHYLSAGFVGIRITPRIMPVVPDLDVVFEIREGQAQVVGPVEIRGLRRTSEKLVRSQVRLEEGEPLDPRKLAATERRLRDLGIFRRAVVTASPDSVARITIELEEAARYHTAWDVRYNAQDSFNGVLDGEIGNILGRGLSVGLRVRGGRWVQEGRTSLHVPSVVGVGDLTASAFYLRETIRTAFELRPEPLLSQSRTEQGFQLQQALHTFHPFEVLYGYRYRRTTCPTRGLPPVSRSNRRLIDPCDQRSLERAGLLGRSPLTLDLGGMDVSAVMDTRDSPINPTRGMFFSVNLVLAPKFLRSDFDYVREFVQSAFITDLTDSITWAHGYSVGFFHTFGGQRLPFDELFKAGGPNTMRGFELDSVGPRTASGEALGGEAVVVINQELRYSHPVTGIGGALFYDAGNVFATTSDFDFKLRHNVGVGLRWDSSFGLLRIDLGIPLGRLENERSYQLYFGFGQAF